LILPFVVDNARGGPSDAVRFIPILGQNAVITGFAIAMLGAMEKALTMLGKTLGQPAAAASAHSNLSSQMQNHNHSHNQSYNHNPNNPPSSSQPHAAPRPQPQQQRQHTPIASAPPGPISTGLLPTPMLMPQRQPNEVVTRGALNGRDYVLFRDGSVVVETL